MRQKIDQSLTRENLDALLKNLYGYGVWEFEFSLAFIHSLYLERKEEASFLHIERRIEQLKNLKKKVIELVDDFSEKIKIYMLNDQLKSTKTKWTAKERYDFITKKYRLNPFLSLITRLINRYKEHRSYLENQGSWKYLDYRIKLKPLNLAVLVWSFAVIPNSGVLRGFESCCDSLLPPVQAFGLSGYIVFCFFSSFIVLGY
ncbi:MAG: hypothetical protein GQ536_03405 [Candidatus Aminicenantes bacterium]|nr:hypothetical protein [Candidatus Aminicenantes bacterium]